MRFLSGATCENKLFEYNLSWIEAFMHPVDKANSCSEVNQ